MLLRNSFEFQFGVWGLFENFLFLFGVDIFLMCLVHYFFGFMLVLFKCLFEVVLKNRISSQRISLLAFGGWFVEYLRLFWLSCCKGFLCCLCLSLFWAVCKFMGALEWLSLFFFYVFFFFFLNIKYFFFFKFFIFFFFFFLKNFFLYFFYFL